VLFWWYLDGIATVNVMQYFYLYSHYQVRLRSRPLTFANLPFALIGGMITVMFTGSVIALTILNLLMLPPACYIQSSL